MLDREHPIAVFISSQIPALEKERSAAADAINSLRLTRSWRFESAPAASDSAASTYLRKVDECEILVIIVGKVITAGVRQEYERAAMKRKRALLFLSEDASRASDVMNWAKSVDLKYDWFRSPRDLGQKVAAAVADELIIGYRHFNLSSQDYETLGVALQENLVSFSVRTIGPSELPNVHEDFPDIADLYPDLDRWLSGKLQSIRHGDAQALIGMYGLEKAGLALTSDQRLRSEEDINFIHSPKLSGAGRRPPATVRSAHESRRREDPQAHDHRCRGATS